MPMQEDKGADSSRLPALPPAALERLEPILTFVIEIVVGTLLFFVVGMAAVAVSMFVQWLEAVKVDGSIVKTFGALEYVVLVCDAILFVLFVVKSTWKTAREIWER